MVDGMPVEIAKLWRARFRRMRRLVVSSEGGKDKQDLQLVSRKSGSYEGTVYGILLMIVGNSFLGRKVF